MSDPRAAARRARRLRRVALVALAFALYVAVFPLAWSWIGDNVAPLAMLPVVAAGWYFGAAAGVGAAVLAVIVTWGLIATVAPDPGVQMLRNALTVVAGLAVGAATGAVRELLRKSRRQARKLEQRHARALLEAGLRRGAEEELRRVNATLEKACDEAVRASDEKSRFLGRASHELRTPLAAIQGYAELLLEEQATRGALPSTADRDLGRIVEAARHLTELVDELLDIAKIETGRLDLHLAPIEVRGLMEDVAAMVQPAAAAAGTRLTIACAEGVPPVRTDARRARQVLLNLLSNAIKFTGDGRVEMVASTAEGERPEWAEIVVRDNGPGMTVDEQQLAFEEFWRGRSDQSGVGLGLAIARRLCREMGGTLAVSATPGVGSAFVVRLPLAAPGPRAQA
ncbi:MAG TPA: HAMP domain-containing sensor histidine kinase [Anaeromyxobacteraceae bacterium]|nr:HAMP domain-containing sensor histidine kinase [Anaeromyxobacteraceae bacterium]